jgi:hypothetical protein
MAIRIGIRQIDVNSALRISREATEPLGRSKLTGITPLRLVIDYVLFMFSYIGHAQSDLVRPRNKPISILHVLWRVRHLGTQADAVLPHMRAPGSYALTEAIKTAVDDYAERETGNRE